MVATGGRSKGIGGRAVFDCRPPSLATLVRGKTLGCEFLAQELFGFGFFVVPLLQLFGTKEVDDVDEWRRDLQQPC